MDPFTSFRHPPHLVSHSSSSSCGQRSLLSWSIARRSRGSGNSLRLSALCTPWCVCTNYVSETGVKSASCNPKGKQEVTAKQKLCSENKGEFKNPTVYIVFSRRRKESSVGEETTWSGRLFQTGIVQGKKENL